jgi:hypothetical protein
MNFIGRRFGKLTVVKGERFTRRSTVTCLCDCGNTALPTVNSLLTGNTKSCGCFRKTSATIHGHAGRHSKRSPTYTSWYAMLQRCTNPKHIAYPRYGLVGVRVSAAWQTFKGFLASMGERPEGTTLGRILDKGDYELGNVFWMTRDEQRVALLNRKSLLKWSTV